MSKTRPTVKIVILTIASTIFLASCATGPDNNQNALRPEGEVAERIMNLFSPIFWIAVAIGVGVLVATIYASIKFRATDKNKSPKQIHGNSVLEIGWTILPLIILIGVAIPTVKTVFDLAKPAKADAVKVQVVGKQWWWQFEVQTDEFPLTNPDGTPKLDAEGNVEKANEVVVANELVVPVKSEIELDLRACDGDTPVLDKTTDELKAANPCNVIHSFWIPSLGGKVDAIPGRKNRLVLKTDKEGLFTGQCAEYCGLSHSVMRMQVRVVSQAEYEKWIENLKKPPVVASVAAEGQTPTSAQRAIEKFGCANCHTFDNTAAVSYGPNLTHYAPDFENEVLGGGSITKNFEQTWKWIFNSTDWRNGNGIPMQADDCRLGPAPGEGKRCVGMPNYSVPYEYEDENGKKVVLPAMTESEAKDIASYLMKKK
jgi:cytochrome c oxidase subunit 2